MCLGSILSIVNMNPKYPKSNTCVLCIHPKVKPQFIIGTIVYLHARKVVFIVIYWQVYLGVCILRWFIF